MLGQHELPSEKNLLDNNGKQINMCFLVQGKLMCSYTGQKSCTPCFELIIDNGHYLLNRTTTAWAKKDSREQPQDWLGHINISLQ